MEYREIESHDRRLVIVASPERRTELAKRINWTSIAGESFPLAASQAALHAGIELPPLGLLLALSPFGLLGIGSALAYTWLNKKPSLPYPIFDLAKVRHQFSFPLNHPIDGAFYACCEAQPYHYVSLATFHQHMYELKLSAFHELCANLGVMRCTTVYAEEKNSKTGGNIGICAPTSAGTASGGFGASVSDRNAAATGIFAEYPRPKRPPTETRTGWLLSEPTWESMQKLRLERNLERWTAEFTYLDEMGVNAKVAASVASIGLDIGGEYQEINRRKWRLDVEFWSST